MADVRDWTGSQGRPAGGVAFGRIQAALAAERCVILDGGVATELPGGDLDEPGWGIRALTEAPAAVLDVHRAYLDAGCDVISTDTWGLMSAAGDNHWLDLARRGLRLARQAMSDREGAIAFSLNGDIDSELGGETARLLGRMFADEAEPPDLILLETLSLLPESLDHTVEALVATGLPVWLSFRRCRRGLCGVYGQHWGGPEGDAFGRAARRFEQLGVHALLINCIPPDHVGGMVSYLRDFVDLPLGVYPNLGYYTERGWRFDPVVRGAEYAELAVQWREEGAQIIGGCCGVRPEHVAAARERLAGTRPGHRRPLAEPPAEAPAAPVGPWTDARGRSLYPLPFPRLEVEPGVIAPGAPSYMAWRYLFQEGIGAGRRCLDVGCGTGILGVQLARNHAAHVHCIDIDARAVSNTLANAFRNGVSDRLTANTVDLYPWVPDERYEVVVASLTQRPTDPFQASASQRRADYWGRVLLEQLIGKLPAALAREGTAYLVQLSLVSQQHTAALLAAAGLEARVVDHVVFAAGPDYASSRAQIERVEALSDAYHVPIGGELALVGYLLEICPTPTEAELRLEALERTEAAVARLSGAVSELLERASAEAAAAAGLTRVLLSRVDDGTLIAESSYGAGALPEPVPLAYPLLEGQLLRRRESALVAPDESPGRQAFWERMRWQGYVAAPVVIGGHAVGFFHGDRDGALTRVEEEALARFAHGFADAFERAVLLRRLREQRAELRRIASWADARSIELTDGAIDLAHDRDVVASTRPAARLDDLLTPREVDVLEHLVRGASNADIARALVVSEGTVKFHVKNILRKLNVSNRAEATAHYLRTSLHAGS